MANLTRDFFIVLSNTKTLQKVAKKWGFRIGADKFVAGTTLEEAIEEIKNLNRQGIATTLDYLGEFVDERQEAIEAKEQILKILDRIAEEKVNSHISIKLTMLGLDIDTLFCLANVKEIVTRAAYYNIFVNIDMEKYIHYEKTLDLLQEIRKSHENVGTVLQTYLLRTIDDLDGLQDVRMRIAKGAYKESAAVAYQSPQEIDANFIKVVQDRLEGEGFTSIATHDHRLIDEIKRFVADQKIDKEKFEFQMLYGFRNDLQHRLVEEGYQFCTYIPFGEDWFGYFMRRIAERPQNMNLLVKDMLFTDENKMKKAPVIASIAVFGSITYFVCKRQKKR